jgi:hypothetical protein
LEIRAKWPVFRDKLEIWLGTAKKATAAFEDLNLAFSIYPDLKPYLAGQQLSREPLT